MAPLPVGWTRSEHMIQDNQCKDGLAGLFRGREALATLNFNTPSSVKNKELTYFNVYIEQINISNTQTLIVMLFVRQFKI